MASTIFHDNFTSFSKKTCRIDFTFIEHKLHCETRICKNKKWEDKIVWTVGNDSLQHLHLNQPQHLSEKKAELSLPGLYHKEELSI